MAIFLLLFVAGVALTAWVAIRWPEWNAQRHAQVQGVANEVAATNAAASEVGNNAAVPYELQSASNLAGPLDVQTARIADLDQRLARISLAAQAASYNANRAEAILIAFAARRALDAGRPLGYVEGALRVRFGDAQPKAVATIVNAATDPVTLTGLQLGLDTIMDGIARPGQPDRDWWSSFWREVDGMAVLRKAGTPPPDPAQRLMRARRAIDGGQVDVAIREVSALSSNDQVQRWLERARRYNEARRALDVIEAAAILEPRTAFGAGLVPQPEADTADAAQSDAAQGEAAQPVAKANPAPASPKLGAR